MQQPLSRSLRQIEPLVRHGIQELREGTSLPHTLAEVAMMGALIGAGASANQAIRTVERLETQLLGGTGREMGETMYHGGMVQQGYAQPGMVTQAYGKPSFATQAIGVPGMATQAYAKPGVATQAYGKPSFATQAYGVPGMATQAYAKPGMATQAYGKQMPMTYSPMGSVWMGK
ncbi:MAG TPA: hypothetical protein VNT75_14415 [Symbiobacteriaceae bacterium]|nr:hypothetical protein [Symbiobacteriaceae bacterium]